MKKTIQINQEIGKILCEILKDIIPDIKNNAEHELGIGTDVIALESFYRILINKDESK